MKNPFLIPLAAPLLVAIFSASGYAQERMYRCDNNYYTNSNATTDPKARGCKLVEGGNVTIVQGTRPAAPGVAPGVLPVKVAAASQAQGAPRAESGNEQRARDSDARQILESELKRAEARQAELSREYNNGEPDKQGGEARNYQKYIDRVAELKASIARNDSDIAGIRRELGRAGGAASAQGASGAK